MERIANHLGDLGYLGNDVALSFGFAQFWILKEQVLRNNAALFGHRYLMDKIVPGGVAVHLNADGKSVIETECDMLEREVGILRWLYRWPLFVPFIIAAQCMRTFLAKNGLMNNSLVAAGVLVAFGGQVFATLAGEVDPKTSEPAEGYLVARLDLGEVRQQREEFQTLQNREPDTYKALVKKY